MTVPLETETPVNTNDAVFAVIVWFVIVVLAKALPEGVVIVHTVDPKVSTRVVEAEGVKPEL